MRNNKEYKVLNIDKNRRREKNTAIAELATISVCGAVMAGGLGTLAYTFFKYDYNMMALLAFISAGFVTSPIAVTSSYMAIDDVKKIKEINKEEQKEMKLTK